MRGAIVCILIVAIVAACGGGDARVEQDFELKNRAEREIVLSPKLSPTDELTLDSPFGGIKITEGEKLGIVATMSVSGRTQGEADNLLKRFDVKATRQSGGVRVHLDGEPFKLEGTQITVTPSVVMEVTLPKGRAVRAKTQSGHIRVTGAFGKMTLSTNFGRIAITGARGMEVRARTSSGDVSVEDVEAPKIWLHTSFGNIEATNVRGVLEAASDSGQVVVRKYSGPSTQLKTSFGTVQAEGVFQQLSAESASGKIIIKAGEGSTAKGPWKIRTNFGRVELNLPKEFACMLDARTSFGAIECTHAITTQGKVGKHLKGRMGTGGQTLTVITDSGDIRIR